MGSSLRNPTMGSVSNPYFLEIKKYCELLGQRDAIAELSPQDQNHIWKYRSKNQDVYGGIQRVANSVVSVSIFSGIELRLHCSGLIIQWDEVKHEAIILTTARLLRFPKNLYSRSAINILVRLADGNLVLAKEHKCDYHYNILTLVVQFDKELPVVELKPQECTEEMPVVALGRHFFTGSILTAGGELQLKNPYFGCEELFSSSCHISEVYEGGPLITATGDVVGVSFYDGYDCAHPLPTSVIRTCLNRWRSCRIIARPWVGFTVIDSNHLTYEAWEKLKILPSETCTVVKKVCEDSPAGDAGVRPGDSVMLCAGHDVVSAQHYSQILRDIAFKGKRKRSILVSIKRLEDGTTIDLEAEFVPASDRRFCYCWPEEKRWLTKPKLYCDPVRI